MKKLFLTAAVAAMALASCSNDQEIASGDKDANGQEIGFRTMTQKTRATETTTLNITDFKVSGFWSETTAGTPDFMYGTNVVRKGTSWEYSPLRYWPTTGDVKFYAYSPAGSASATNFATTATTPEIEYVVSNVTAMQEDFLVASTAALTSGTVELTFKHALSQVVVEAQSAVQDVTFEITSVELTNLESAGKLDLSASPLVWAAPAVAAPLTYSAALLPVTVGYDGDPTTFQAVTGPNDGLMIRPQVFVAGDATDVDDAVNSGSPDGIPDDLTSGVFLIVTYNSVAAPNTPLETGKKAYISLDLSTLGTNVGTNEFEMGVKYKFQLTLAGNMAPIAFSVTAVETWDPAVVVPLP